MGDRIESLIERWDGLGVVASHHRETGSWIFIALHDDTLGRPTGGCRLRAYESPAEGLRDAMRLAEGMTWKWAAMDFGYGGGKSVLAVPGPLEGAARRARKYRGALITGTQSVNDYYANAAARAAWDNSDWTIFLAQKDESVELLKREKRIHCDPGMEQALKSLTTADGRFAELVLHGPDGWRVARLVLDAWSVALYSSRGPAFAAVEKLKAEGLTTVEAIDRVVGVERPTFPENSKQRDGANDPERSTASADRREPRSMTSHSEVKEDWF